MAVFEAPRLVRLLAALTTLGMSAAASAQPAQDGGAAVTPTSEVSGLQAPLPWHGSLFFWEHAVGTQTIGIGQDYQSFNPTYEMTFRLAPRYYFLEDEAMSLSVRADVRLLREFTNSDTTTKRGEWTFLDTELWLAEVATLSNAPGRHSELIFRAPLLTLPTSKVSYESGRTLGLGVGVGLDQTVPLRGEQATLLPRLLLRPRLTYSYQFANAKVATSDEIDRVRLDPEGRALPSDQLTGSALPEHQVSATLRADTTITEQLGLVAEFGMRYARRYDLPDSTECVLLATGCAEVPATPDRSRWAVQTLFSVALGYSPVDYLEIGVSYGNLAPQLGADGRRRNVFYSLYAQAALDFTVALDLLYQRATGRRSSDSSHTAARSVSPAF